MADGMKIDNSGLLWCCGPGGIHVFEGISRTQGIPVGMVRTSKVVANLAWGGMDGTTLFLAATDCLVSVQTTVGRAVPHQGMKSDKECPTREV